MYRSSHLRAFRSPTTLFNVRGFDDLTGVPDRPLQAGSPFIVEMQLKRTFPVAHLFNTPGVRSLFSGLMPPGLGLNSVHSNGSRTVVVETTTASAFGQTATMGAFFLAPLLAFIGANWIRLVIGTFLLTFLVEAIRGKGVVDTISETAGTLNKTLLLAAIGGIVFLVLSSRRSRA